MLGYQSVLSLERGYSQLLDFGVVEDQLAELRKSTQEKVRVQSHSVEVINCLFLVFLEYRFLIVVPFNFHGAYIPKYLRESFIVDLMTFGGVVLAH